MESTELKALVIRKQLLISGGIELKINRNRETGIEFCLATAYLGPNQFLYDGFQVRMDKELLEKNNIQEVCAPPEYAWLTLEYVRPAKEGILLKKDEVEFEYAGKVDIWHPNCNCDRDLSYIAVFGNDPEREDYYYHECKKCSDKHLSSDLPFVMCENIVLEITQKEYRLLKNVKEHFVMRVGLQLEGLNHIIAHKKNAKDRKTT